MEKKEELLERLVNGIETQNKLIAMLLADSIGIPNFDFLSDKQKISALNVNADIIMALIYDATPQGQVITFIYSSEIPGFFINYKIEDYGV